MTLRPPGSQPVRPGQIASTDDDAFAVDGMSARLRCSGWIMF
jgi:hypothetical protein